MREHAKSKRCLSTRRESGLKADSPSIKELLTKGTKTGLRFKTSSKDSEVPEVFCQAEFDQVFLQGLLAVNLAFNVSNNVAFRKMFRYLNCNILIPSPSTISSLLLACYNQVVAQIKADIPPNVKISIAADAWTSPNKMAFLAVVAYYIDDNWELQEVLIGFEHIKGRHDGETLAALIENILHRYDVADRLLGFTTDNASNNTTLSKALTSALEHLSIEWDCESYHIPCMAHVIQLILGAFMQELKIKTKDERMPSGFKETYIEKVKSLDKGFYKTVEKHRKLAIAVGASPQRREYFLELQDGRVTIPVALVHDVKTRWNSTLVMLERALRMREFTKEWIKHYPKFKAIWATPDEWKQVEYILEVLAPIRFWTLWMSKTHTITIHRVFEVYQNIFDHIEYQIEKLTPKRMKWKTDIKAALDKALLKAKVYYGKTENPRGLLLNLATCLNPYQKLSLYREWDEDEGVDPASTISYTSTYRQQFLDYYEKHYAPPAPAESNGQLERNIRRRMGVKSRSKHPSSEPTVIARLHEAVQYIDSPPELEPLEPIGHSNDPDKPQGRFYETNLLHFWRFASGASPNMARMAKDILAVPANGVGVERVFNVARDQLPYRRNRMKSTAIRASMIVKLYHRTDMSKTIQSSDVDPVLEAKQFEKHALQADLEFFLQKQDQDMVYISDEDEIAKMDIDWSFVDDNGERAFDRDSTTKLPLKSVNSIYPAGQSQLGSRKSKATTVDEFAENEVISDLDEGSSGDDGDDELYQMGIDLVNETDHTDTDGEDDTPTECIQSLNDGLESAIVEDTVHVDQSTAVQEDVSVSTTPPTLRTSKRKRTVVSYEPRGRKKDRL